MTTRRVESQFDVPQLFVYLAKYQVEVSGAATVITGVVPIIAEPQL